MAVTWKTILIIVIGLVFIIVVLLLIFGVFRPFEFKFPELLEQLDRAIKSLFDISEWSW